MQIEIIKTNVTEYSNIGRYFFAEMRSGKHHASFAFGPDSVQVCVHNASNRAWRGLGKRFNTVTEALANYRTAEIRAMIEHASELAGQ